jgi:hypothetical protein
MILYRAAARRTDVRVAPSPDVTTLDRVHPQAVLHAAVEYARNGDAGALRFLCARFPGLDTDELAAEIGGYDGRSMPFGAWASRVASNKAVARGAAAQPPPEDLVAELVEALRQLHPAERLALRQALSRSGS